MTNMRYVSLSEFVRLFVFVYVSVSMCRVALIVPACQPGWEEMENLRGNLVSIRSSVSKQGGESVVDIGRL